MTLNDFVSVFMDYGDCHAATLGKCLIEILSVFNIAFFKRWEKTPVRPK
jgi:hypothetical protein